MFKKLIKSKALRTRTSWILALVLVPPFIFFFHMFGSGPPAVGPGAAAGSLFGQAVPWDVYQRQYDWVRRTWLSQFGQLPQDSTDALIESTWNRILLLETARRESLRVTDAELTQAIASQATFQVDGQFSRERYRQFVDAIGIGAPAYEEFTRDQLLIQKLISQVNASVSVSDADVRDAFTRERERLTATVFLIDPATFREAAGQALTEEDLRAEYAANPQAFEVPEQVTFDYLGLTRDEAAQQTSIADADIAAYYEERPDEFALPDGGTRPLEEVREDINTQLLRRAIRRRLNVTALDLEDALEAGRAFEELASAHALPIRRVGPTDVGNLWIANAPEPVVMEAAFGLAEGEMSRLVETDNGLYVVKVAQRTPAVVPPFEEMHEQIRQRLSEQRARTAASDTAQALRRKLTDEVTTGAPLDAIAAQLHLTPLRPGPFTRIQPIDGLGVVPAVNAAAFTTSLGEVSEVIAIPNGFVVLIPQERLDADLAQFEAARDALRQQLLDERQQTYFAQWLADLRASADLQSFVEASPDQP